MSTQVAVVIPTLGTRHEWLIDTASSVYASSQAARLVIVAPLAKVTELRSILNANNLGAVRVHAQQGKGPVSAIEEGWAVLPDPEFCAWIGDDDLLASGGLDRAAAALTTRPRSNFAFGRTLYIDGEGLGYVETRPGPLAPFLLRHGFNQIGQPGSVYRRAAIKRVGGLRSQWGLGFDLDLHMRLCFDGPATYLPRRLASYRVHEGALSSLNDSASRQQARDIYLANVGRRVRRIDPLVGLLGRLNYKLTTRRPEALP